MGGKNIIEFCDMSVVEAVEFIDSLELSETHMKIAEEILKEIRGKTAIPGKRGSRLSDSVESIGDTFGGESQRIRLATQIGSGLIGVLYILDEPSIGLHQKGQ